MLNGDGIRVVLWLSGCNHHCDGCQNIITWNANTGLVFDFDAKKEIFEELKKDYISGITFSGGDPLHENNRQEVFELIRKIKTRFLNKTIWFYTGYEWEEIVNQPNLFRIVSLVDVVVVGRFELDKRDVNYRWAGSTNQRVINVKKTLEEKEIVFHESD